MPQDHTDTDHRLEQLAVEYAALDRQAGALGTKWDRARRPATKQRLQASLAAMYKRQDVIVQEAIAVPPRGPRGYRALARIALSDGPGGGIDEEKVVLHLLRLIAGYDAPVDDAAA